MCHHSRAHLFDKPDSYPTASTLPLQTGTTNAISLKNNKLKVSLYRGITTFFAIEVSLPKCFKQFLLIEIIIVIYIYIYIYIYEMTKVIKKTILLIIKVIIIIIIITILIIIITLTSGSTSINSITGNNSTNNNKKRYSRNF